MPKLTLNDEEVAVMKAVLAALAVTKDGKLVLRDDKSSKPFIVKGMQLETLNSIAKKMKLRGIIIPDFDMVQKPKK
jgi:hypothetical protein